MTLLEMKNTMTKKNFLIHDWAQYDYRDDT